MKKSKFTRRSQSANALSEDKKELSKLSKAQQVEIENLFFDICLLGDTQKLKDFERQLKASMLQRFGVDGVVLACKKNHLDTLKYLLSKNFTKFFGGEKELKRIVNAGFIAACEEGNLEIVRYLLTSEELSVRADARVNGDSGLIWASISGHLNVVKYLLTSEEISDKCDVGAQENYSFKLACFNNRLEVVNYFIFDLKIKQTDKISSYIEKTANAQKIFSLFKLRDEKELVDLSCTPPSQEIETPSKKFKV